MSDFRNFLNKQLEDPEFKAEWEALQPELSLVQAMIDARKVSGLTQKELVQYVQWSHEKALEAEAAK